MPPPLEQDYIGLSDRNLRETELRLGLPGSDSPDRGSSVGLTLSVGPSSGAKRGFSDAPAPSPAPAADRKPPSSKQQVVGWPPVRSYRRNSMATTAAASKKKEEEADGGEGKLGLGFLYVKVSMDGAPYLRKVDIKMYSDYKELSSALEKMFSCFTIGQCGSHNVPGRDGLTESRLMDLLNGSEYVLTYEDKDGDWMLVGDVPWDMFTDSCKRLRIMKSSDAIGLGMFYLRRDEGLSETASLSLGDRAPRAMEESKTRN